jgi:hypothetical protein
MTGSRETTPAVDYARTVLRTDVPAHILTREYLIEERARLQRAVKMLLEEAAERVEVTEDTL